MTTKDATGLSARLRQQVVDDHVRGCMGRQYSCNCGYDLATEGLLEMAADEIDRLTALIAAGGHLSSVEPQAAPERYETLSWFNGCDETVPQALRYLAENDRPVGGQSSFNSEHLYQLASEIERMTRWKLFRKVIGAAPTASPLSRPEGK